METKEITECEKCGEEAGTRFAGDEAIIYCIECNWVTNL